MEGPKNQDLLVLRGQSPHKPGEIAFKTQDN